MINITKGDMWRLAQDLKKKTKKVKQIPRWSELKRSILNRDDYQCRICYADATEAQMHIHHIDADRTRNESKNLITLCRSCHEHIHRESFIKGRMSWDEDNLPWDNREMKLELT